MSLAKQFCFLKLLKVIKAKTKDRLKPGKFLDEAKVKFTNILNKEFKFWIPDLEEIGNDGLFKWIWPM